ncbi:MAG: LytTR family DNA-binding domain-containing protein [Prevotellaceae bacterium]|jgi:two-component system LytT family response regulator|nr:LytTR family DNA-binding domain-containing protein [Prevotellaceae bacterium]
MINCITIDDEPLALAQLEGYISRIPFLHLEASCQDAFEAMDVLSSRKVDLMFVDINIPNLNGLEFVKSLSEKPVVIFTTAYSEYAIDGFRADAIDYLLKPFSFEDFLKAAEKAYKWIGISQKKEPVMRLPEDEENLFVKSDYRTTRIRLSDIKYIEGMSEYVRIYIEGDDKVVMPLLSIKRLEELLPPERFMRVHRSYIVNLEQVTEISRMRIVFGETFVPIGENYKERFMEYVNQRIMR